MCLPILVALLHGQSDLKGELRASSLQDFPGCVCVCVVGGESSRPHSYYGVNTHAPHHFKKAFYTTIML